jgi:hypothetical protein
MKTELIPLDDRWIQGGEIKSSREPGNVIQLDENLQKTIWTKLFLVTYGYISLDLDVYKAQYPKTYALWQQNQREIQEIMMSISGLCPLHVNQELQGITVTDIAYKN